MLFLAVEPPILIAQNNITNNLENNITNNFRETINNEEVRGLVSGNETRLIVQENGGQSQEFQIKIDENKQDNPPSVPVNIGKVSVVEIFADRQEYDEKQQLVTATGNVVMRFNQAVLTAEKVEINIATRLAVAEGEVKLRRGNQLLMGTRFEYFFAKNSGVVYNAQGEIDQSTSSRDFDLKLPTDINNLNIRDPQVSQPLSNIRGREGISFDTGSIGGENLPNNTEGGGQINQIRFQASRIDFEGEKWQAQEVRITNDPFSPPELEIRADSATLTPLRNGSNELRTKKSRVVLDQKVSLPLFQNKLVFDNRDRQPSVFQMGYDGEEKGGVYVQGNFTIVKSSNLEFSLSPQLFVQEAISEGFSEDVLGIKGKLNFDLSPRTSFKSSASLTSFNFNNIEDNLRTNVRLQQSFGDLKSPYNLNLEYTYRDRLFNGSLGYQTVQSSLGGVLTSPSIALGKSGINLSFQVGVQDIEANTDRLELLKPDRENDRVSLTRYQGAIALGKGFTIWEGKAKPATKEEGLRYRRSPVVPNLNLYTGITTVGSFYSNGDDQISLSGSVGLQAQLGHFARKFFDYTRLNLSYTKVFKGDESPFLFDRIGDSQTLSFGVTQQIYGPFLAGFQTYLNLDTGKEISTDLLLEYSRRTHNIILRYNPVLQMGSIGIKITDFNWTGDTKPFDSDIKPVIQGVER